jgi:hypothetical protein
MKLEVEVIEENEDGSADATINFDREALALLIQWGMVAMLKEAVNNDLYNPKKKKAKK